MNELCCMIHPYYRCKCGWTICRTCRNKYDKSPEDLHPEVFDHHGCHHDWVIVCSEGWDGSFHFEGCEDLCTK